MEGEIGDAAGLIWQYLNEHDQTTLGKLRQGTKVSDQLLLMGVGWLAREGKISVVQQGRTVKSRCEKVKRHLRFARESGTRDARDG